MNKNILLSLKVSEKRKYANKCQWFKDFAQYNIPSYSAMVTDYDKMKLNYEIVNNDLSGFRTQLNDYCTMLGEELSEKQQEALLPYNKLHNKKNVLVGELLKRTDDTKAVLLGSKQVQEKNKQLEEAVKRAIYEQIEIEQQKAQLRQEGGSNYETDQIEKQQSSQNSVEDIVNKNFLSEWEIYGNKVLKIAQYFEDVRSKKAESLEDLICSDRFIVYSGWKAGKPFIKNINPLYCGYRKSVNSAKIQHSDIVWYKESITVIDAMQEYMHELSDSDIEDLLSTNSATSTKDARHDVLSGTAEYLRDLRHHREFKAADERSFESKNIGTHQQQGVGNDLLQETFIWKTHIEFKAFRQVAFLTYLNEYNEEITEIVSEEFEVPKDAVKEEFYNNFGQKSERQIWVDPFSQVQYSIEFIYIPRKYEVTRLGENVYVDCREVPNQPIDIDDPYNNFELSYKGLVLSDRNANSISMVGRAIPYQFQYFYVKYIQNKEFSKYRSYIQSVDIDQIPDQLGLDADGEPIRDKVVTYLKFVKETNIDLYSGSQTSNGGLGISTRSPGSTGYTLGAAAELLNLQQLLEFIDREISLTMGITPQREGAFSSNSNVSDNRQAITQSHHITEIYYYKLNDIWRDVLDDYLRNFTHYLKQMFKNSPNKKEHFIHYILPDGTEDLLKITPDILDHAKLGVWLSNNSHEVKYNDMMIQSTHAFAQNAGEGVEAVSSILKAITSGTSPEETHKLIQKESKKQQQRALELQQAQAEAQEKQIQMEIENREDIQRHELEKIRLEKELSGKIEIEKALINADSKVFANAQDVNDNDIPDRVEEARAKGQLELEKIRLQHQSTENEKDRQVKREEIKVKKQQNSNKSKN